VLELHCLADGGEGFVNTMLTALGGKEIKMDALDPIGRKTEAFYGILNNGTAVIEMAAASGIELLSKNERNPLITSTYGTGQMMKHAMENGCRKLIIGIGGSATNDGGTGMAKALGYRFLDKDGKDIAEGGGALNQLSHMDQSGVFYQLNDTEILIACDVSNPLTGEKGASAVYGPQKGANKEMVAHLDSNLENLARVIKKDMGKDILKLPGGGAAGGLGAGLVAFAKGDLKKGFDIVKEQTGLEEHIKNADLVFTGEGKIDGQTIHGKTPWGVAQIAKKYNKLLIAIAGVLGEGYRDLYEEGFTSIFSLPNGPATLEACINHAPELLADMGERIFRLLKYNKI